MQKTKIRLGGVPEHFNLPIHLAIENGEFEDKGIDASWTDYDGGTGQMTKALRNDEVDLCVLLTEGIIADIIKGNPSKLISVYVTTPLCWGVHTGYNNPLKLYDDVFEKKIAISRFGSGSHLMPIVDAYSKSKKINDDQFVIINNLSNAIDKLASEEVDVFYWEKFTTHPYVEKSILRRIGEFYTPWPCFVIAATDKIIDANPELVKQCLSVIHQSCDKFMQDDKSINLVSERYNLDESDVHKWFDSTEWAVNGWISNKMLKSTMSNLLRAGIIKEAIDSWKLVWLR